MRSSARGRSYLQRRTRQVMSSDWRVCPTKFSTLIIRNWRDSLAGTVGRLRTKFNQRASENSSPAELKASTTPSVKRTRMSPGCNSTSDVTKVASVVMPRGSPPDSKRSVRPSVRVE